MANTYDITQKLQAIADAIENGGGGGGGGTTVIANPTGTPTADLDTVQIGQVIYDIPGSGGGGGSAYREDIIFTGSNSDTSPITLTADINYYDLLQFIVAYVDHKVTETFEVPVNYFVNNYTYSTFTDIHNTDNISLTLAGNEWFRIARGQIDTQLQFMKGSNFYLKSVIGIKLPRGAGSDEAVDINYDNTTSGLTATNVQDAIDENADSISTLNSKFSWKKVGEFTTNGNLTISNISNCTEIMFIYVLSKPRVTLITIPLDVFKVTGVLADYMLYTTRCNFTAEYVNDTTISISSISSLANGSVQIYAR